MHNDLCSNNDENSLQTEELKYLTGNTIEQSISKIWKLDFVFFVFDYQKFNEQYFSTRVYEKYFISNIV